MTLFCVSDYSVMSDCLSHQKNGNVCKATTRILHGLPFLTPGDLPDPGIESASPALAGRSFTTESPGKPWLSFTSVYITSQSVVSFITLTLLVCNESPKGQKFILTFCIKWYLVTFFVVCFYCSIVNLQLCVSLGYTAKWLIDIYTFFNILFHYG